MLPPLGPAPRLAPLPPPALPAPVKPYGFAPLHTAQVGDGDKPGAAGKVLDLRL